MSDAIEERIAAIDREIPLLQERIRALARERSVLRRSLRDAARRPMGRPRIQNRHGNSAGYVHDHCRCPECKRWNRNRPIVRSNALSEVATIKKRLIKAGVFTKESWEALGSDEEVALLIASQRQDKKYDGSIYQPPNHRSIDAPIRGTDGLTLLDVLAAPATSQ